MTSIKDKPGGRPAKKRIEKQQRVVSTKLTELQYYAIRKRAGEAGLRVSEYVRQAVVSAEVIPRLNRQDADTIRKLAGEANNINQLAHRANAGGFALVAVELVKLKNRIIGIINHLSDDWKNKKGKRFVRRIQYMFLLSAHHVLVSVGNIRTCAAVSFHNNSFDFFRSGTLPFPCFKCKINLCICQSPQSNF